MYILFNESGNIVTSIPHGEQVRQDNPFDLFICFPNERKYENLEPIAEFSIKGKFVMAGIPQSDYWGHVITFRKRDVNEMTFEFKEGEKYICYHINVPASYKATAVSGSVPMVVSVVVDGVTRLGRATITVARTYGSDDVSGIDENNFKILLSKMKQNSTVFTFNGEPMNGAVSTDLAIYAWKSMAFVRGTIRLDAQPYDLEPFEGDEDYSAVAYFVSSMNLTYPSTIIGHSNKGEDYEFKVVGKENVIYVLLNRSSDIIPTEDIYLCGMFMVTLDELEFEDEDEDGTVSRIRKISGVSATYEYVQDGEDGVLVTYDKSSEGDDVYDMNFEFMIKNPSQVVDVQSPISNVNQRISPSTFSVKLVSIGEKLAYFGGAFVVSNTSHEGISAGSTMFRINHAAMLPFHKHRFSVFGDMDGAEYKICIDSNGNVMTLSDIPCDDAGDRICFDTVYAVR